jgi:plastocyanin
MKKLPKKYFESIWHLFCCLVLPLIISVVSQAQVTHEVTVQNFSFSPATLVINQGDIVVWVNEGGFHNVNGTLVTFPDNTSNFGNSPASAPWTFVHTFVNSGTNNYRCDIHPMMQGVITVTPYDCPDLQANIGDSCQTNISLDHIAEVNENCECEITAFHCGEFGLGWSGTVCDDGNPNTENDVVTLDCECMGTPIFCADLDAFAGDLCDDDNETTLNDIVTSECICMGTSIFDCPELQLNFDDPCNDNDPNTENDAVTFDCNCVGTSIFDCPELQLNIGDSCNDNNPDTEDDTVQNDCSCSGEFAAPDNDEPCGAVSLACGETLDATTTFATQSLEPMDCVGIAPEPIQDVWFRFSHSGEGFQYTIETSGLSTDVGLYSGACTAAQYEMCGSQLLTTSPLNAGEYLVRIYGVENPGDFTVSLSCQSLGINELPGTDQVIHIQGDRIIVLIPEKVSKIMFYDLAGKLVQERSAFGDVTLVSGIGPGIYVAVAYDYSGTAIQSLKIFKP